MLPPLLLAAALLSEPALEPAAPDIVALEQRLFRGIERRDRAAIDQLLADDFALRGNPDLDRETWLANAVALCWGPRWNLRALTVRELGDTQVASFVLHFYRDPLTCREAALQSLITDVWARRDGQWKLVVRHAGPVGEDGPRAQYGMVPLEPPPFEGRAELSFVSTGGNAATETLGFSAEAIRRARRATTSARASFVRTSSDNTENAQALNAQARHGIRLSDQVEAYVRAGYFRDLFSGIEHRANTDAGLSFVVPQSPRRTLKFDFGLGATREVRVADDDLAALNATVGASFRSRLTGANELTAESQAVTDLERPTNWRLANDVSITSGFNAVLSARLAYSIRYVNQPVLGFRRTDRTVSAALVIRYAPHPRPATR